MFSIRKVISEASVNIQLCAGKQLVEISKRLDNEDITVAQLLDMLGIKCVIEAVGDRQIIKFAFNEINTGDKLEFAYDGVNLIRQYYRDSKKVSSEHTCPSCGVLFMELMYGINYKANLVQSLTYFSENPANRLLKIALTSILALPSDEKPNQTNTEERISTIYYKEVPEVNGYYLWEPIRGGVSAIVDRNGEKLYAGSSISFEEHLRAFKEGRRS